jgi:uncharacterized protein (DUF362 family)
MSSNAITTQSSQEIIYKVSKVSGEKDLRRSIETAVELIGGFHQVISPGDTVTIKPNLNTSDPYPGSSDTAFIKALGEAILDAGAHQLKIMDSATIRVKTRKVAENLGLIAIAEELDAELIFLDEHPWIKKELPKGKYTKRVAIGEPALDTGKLVLAPCLKTHRFARFTGSMKLLFGFIKRQDRLKAHMRNLEYKLIDCASFFDPALVVMDARKVFVCGGPMSGKVAEPNMILASQNMLAIDVVGVKLLQSYNEKNRLNRPVWKIPQIMHAVELGLGPTRDEEIQIIESN